MSDGARDRVLRVALAIWVGLFIAFLGTSVTTHNEPLRVIGFWGYGVPIVLAAAWCLTRRLTLPDLGAMAALVALLLVSWMSSDVLGSLETSGLGVAYASTFVVAARVTSAKWRSAIAIGVSLPVSIWMLMFAVVWTADRIEWIAHGGGFPPHIAQSAHMWLGTDLVAMLLLLSVPFYAWVRWRALRRLLILVTGVAAIAVVPMSDARATWIAAIAGLLTLIMLTPAARERVWPVHRSAVVVAAGTVVLVAVAAVASGAVGTLSGRTNIWTTAIATFGSNPLSGTGPATFSWARLVGTPPFFEPFPVFQAHNIVLQTLADGGLILLGGLAVALSAWLITIVPAVTTLDSRSRLAAAVLVAFGIVILFDDPLQLPAFPAMALTLAGFMAAASPSFRRARRHAVPVRFATAAVLLVAGGLTTPPIFAASEARTAASEAREAAVSGDWESALTAFDRAALLWPSRAPYQLGLGLAAAHLGEDEEARSHYAAAARLSPGDPRPAGALAALTDDPEERVVLLERAARLMSRDPQYRYRLGLELSATGRDAAAVRELARAVVIDPQVLTVIEEWDSQTLAAVIDAVPTVLTGEADRMAIEPVSVTAQADVILGRIEPSNPPSLVALAAARAGDRQLADYWMDRAFQVEPFAERTYEAGIAIAEAACDESEARRLRTLRDIAPGGFTSLYHVGADIVEARDHVYREMGLGDYQPPSALQLDVVPYSWPRAFLAGIGCTQAKP